MISKCRLVDEKIGWYLWKEKISECNKDICEKAHFFWVQKFHLEGYKENQGDQEFIGNFIFNVWRHPIEPCWRDIHGKSDFVFRHWLRNRVRDSEPFWWEKRIKRDIL
jgi:hypothetical protein